MIQWSFVNMFETKKTESTSSPSMYELKWRSIGQPSQKHQVYQKSNKIMNKNYLKRELKRKSQTMIKMIEKWLQKLHKVLNIMHQWISKVGCKNVWKWFKNKLEKEIKYKIK